MTDRTPAWGTPHDSPAHELGPGFRDAACVFLCLDGDARIVDLEGDGVGVLGVARAQALGRPFEALFPAHEERVVVRAALQRVARGQAPVTLELSQGDAGDDHAPRLAWRLSPLGPGFVLAVAHDSTHLQQREALRSGEERLLSMLATNEDLGATLDELLSGIERRSPDMLCSILRYEASGTLHCVAAPSLPSEYTAAIDGVSIGPSVGSCGTAAHRLERVVVRDIASDPLWADYRQLVLPHGLRACWSQPVISSKGKLLGTLAMYYRHPRGPTPGELAIIERAAHLAGIALERRQSDLESERLHASMQNAQKLDSLGLLAGGIAHDFNNLLVSILGNAELVRAALPKPSRLACDVDEILSAGWRAADLCRQLLAYAGRAQAAPSPVDWNRTVQEVTQMMRASLPQGIDVVVRPEADLPPVEIDPAQAQQVVMNLVRNAAEAIGDEVGTITVTTSRCEVEAGGPPSVKLVVEDTGRGMDDATLGQLFDPFFTTKPGGHGLGLAVLLGIVHARSGTVRVTSHPGAGARFEVVLPAATDDDAVEPEVSRTHVAPRGGTGVVLVVDDEPAVRSVARRMLQRLGYEVLEAENGVAALGHLHADVARHIRAVLLDLRMPGMSGEEVYTELRKMRPRLAVVVSTGYGPEEALRRFEGEPGVTIVRKPYEMAELDRALPGPASARASGDGV